MNQTHRLLSGFGVAVLAFSLPLDAFQAPERPFTFTKGKQGPSAPLWRDRGNMETLDVFHGAGGKAHLPTGRFTFVKEDKDGTQPKFEVVDAQGVRWKAKLGDEARSETAATRLVWGFSNFSSSTNATSLSLNLPQRAARVAARSSLRGSA